MSNNSINPFDMFPSHNYSPHNKEAIYHNDPEPSQIQVHTQGRSSNARRAPSGSPSPPGSSSPSGSRSPAAPIPLSERPLISPSGSRRLAASINEKSSIIRAPSESSDFLPESSDNDLNPPISDFMALVETPPISSTGNPIGATQTDNLDANRSLNTGDNPTATPPPLDFLRESSDIDWLSELMALTTPTSNEKSLITKAPSESSYPSGLPRTQTDNLDANRSLNTGDNPATTLPPLDFLESSDIDWLSGDFRATPPQLFDEVQNAVQVQNASPDYQPINIYDDDAYSIEENVFTFHYYISNKPRLIIFQEHLLNYVQHSNSVIRMIPKRVLIVMENIYQGMMNIPINGVLPRILPHDVHELENIFYAAFPEKRIPSRQELHRGETSLAEKDLFHAFYTLSFLLSIVNDRLLFSRMIGTNYKRLYLVLKSLPGGNQYQIMGMYLVSNLERRNSNMYSIYRYSIPNTVVDQEEQTILKIYFMYVVLDIFKSIPLALEVFFSRNNLPDTFHEQFPNFQFNHYCRSHDDQVHQEMLYNDQEDANGFSERGNESGDQWSIWYDVHSKHQHGIIRKVNKDPQTNRILAIEPNPTEVGNDEGDFIKMDILTDLFRLYFPDQNSLYMTYLRSDICPTLPRTGKKKCR